MYYLMMKTAFRTHFKSKTLSLSKTYTPLREKETFLVNFKLYQKLLILLISFSTILIFPESPKQLENICETYYSRKTCNVW